MPRLAKQFALLCALLTFAAVAYATDDGHDKDRAAITTDGLLSDTAAENKDANGMTAFLAVDFTEVNKGGAVDIHNRAEVLKTWTQVFAVADKVTCHTTISDITFTKEGATVLTALEMNVSITAHGQTMAFTHKDTSRQEWVKTADGWTEQRSTTLTSDETRDGKPMHQHGAP